MALWPDLYEIEAGLPPVAEEEDEDGRFPLHAVSLDEGGDDFDMNQPSAPTDFYWWPPSDVEAAYLTTFA